MAVAGCPLPVLLGVRSGAAQLLGRALALVPSDSHEAGRRLSFYGRAMTQEEGNYEVAQEAFDQALAIARREGDERLDMLTFAYAAQADGHQGLLEDCLQKSPRAIELSARVGDLHSEAMAHWWASDALRRQAKDIERTRYHVQAMLVAAEQLRDRYLMITALRHNESVDYRICDWLSARRFSDLGLALESDPRLLATRVLLEYEAGEFKEGQGYLERLLEMICNAPAAPTVGHALMALVVSLIGRITGADPGLETVRSVAETVLSLQPDNQTVATPARAGLALQAVLQSDVATAQRHYDALLSRRGLLDVHTGISVDRLLALLAQTWGQHDQAMVHFEAACVLLEGGVHRPELAWTGCDYADALLARVGLEPASTRDDREKAKSLLAESLAIAQELGMRPLAERVATRLETIESLPNRAPAFPDGLTRREVEVLGLIALGRSNREIAEELFISPSTVVHHSSDILSKTGAANRADAVMYGARQGLVSL